MNAVRDAVGVYRARMCDDNFLKKGLHQGRILSTLWGGGLKGLNFPTETSVVEK